MRIQTWCVWNILPLSSRGLRALISVISTCHVDQLNAKFHICTPFDGPPFLNNTNDPWGYDWANRCRFAFVWLLWTHESPFVLCAYQQPGHFSISNFSPPSFFHLDLTLGASDSASPSPSAPSSPSSWVSLANLSEGIRAAYWKQSQKIIKLLQYTIQRDSSEQDSTNSTFIQ
eukprot:4648-Hanusia_phi.AAC.4